MTERKAVTRAELVDDEVAAMLAEASPAITHYYDYLREEPCGSSAQPLPMVYSITSRTFASTSSGAQLLLLASALG